MTAREKENKQRFRLLRWQGVLAGRTRVLRIMTAALLTMASFALAFTQLGFFGVGFNGEYSTYVVTSLLPVAASAVLLGTLAGTIIGFVSGALLFTHATLMPLDFYELAFITPGSSIVMLGISGLLIGVLSAFVLRNDPDTVKRTIYLVIVSFIVSIIYTNGFLFNAIVEVIQDLIDMGVATLSDTEADKVTRDMIATAIFRLGDLDNQILFDALAMALVCIISDRLGQKAYLLEGVTGLRTFFAAWLSAVLALAFMIMSVATFASITVGELSQARNSMKSEISYLNNQLDESNQHLESLEDFITSTGIDVLSLDDEVFDELGRTVSYENLLKGYTPEEDGIVFICESDGNIILSDDEQIASSNSTYNEYFNLDIVEAIETSAETGEMQRVIYDKEKYDLDDIQSVANRYVQSEVAYLMSSNESGFTVTIIQMSSKVFANRASVLFWSTLSFFVLLVAVFVSTALLLNRVVARRIDTTNAALDRVTQGDLNARVEAGNTREFDSLSKGINKTVDALKGWIAEAESRMDAELSTAKAIQESALPRTFPPFPDILKFDIYATMHPAREVGGDFYDFFLIGDDCGTDEGKLGFVIADVSGKGVPAALFMMKAMTQVRNYMTSGIELGEAIENANRQLCDGNSAGMFVTVWAGILDYATRHVDFVNAGHNPPLLWTRNGWRWVTERSGIPLGLFDGMPYRAYSIDCQIGDQFLLYTDGVTEAMDNDGELYGEERLESIANENYPLHPRALIEAVRHDVAAHAADADQSDDITMLALEIGVPPEVTATLIVNATVQELDRVNEFIHTELDRRLCPLRAQTQLDIAVEELFVNVAHYAYPDATPENPGTARISYTYSADPPSITIDIADDGIPYNPLAKPDAVTPDDIMKVPIGGLGILMAKRSVDEMNYVREDESNIVTIVKKW